jgi:hypothetical protein
MGVISQMKSGKARTTVLIVTYNTDRIPLRQKSENRHESCDLADPPEPPELSSPQAFGDWLD